MTREEYIKFANALKNNYTIDFDKLPEFCDMAISALSAEPCREADDYENEIADLHNRLDIAEYDKERYKEEITTLEAKNKGEWIPVSERLPKTDNKNDINSFNVLLWVKNKTHPEKEAQIYLGKLMHVDGDDGSGNFWGIKTEPCEWTIWGWSYFNEPEVIAWMPLPEPYKADMRGKVNETYN